MTHPLDEPTSDNINRLRTHVEGMEVKLDANTVTTQQTQADVRELVEWMRGFKALWLISNFMAKALSTVGVILGAIIAVKWWLKS